MERERRLECTCTYVSAIAVVHKLGYFYGIHSLFSRFQSAYLGGKYRRRALKKNKRKFNPEVYAIDRWIEIL